MEGVKDIERLKKMNGKVKSVLPDWLTPHFSAAPGTSSQGDALNFLSLFVILGYVQSVLIQNNVDRRGERQQKAWLRAWLRAQRAASEE